MSFRRNFQIKKVWASSIERKSVYWFQRLKNKKKWTFQKIKKRRTWTLFSFLFKKQRPTTFIWNCKHLDTEFYLFLRKQIMNCMNLIIIWYPPKIAFCFSWCCWVFFSFSYQLLQMFYFSQFPRVLFSLLCCFSVNAFMEEVALHCFQGKVGVGAIVFVVQGGKIGFWIFIFVNTTQEKTSNINSGILRFWTCREVEKR